MLQPAVRAVEHAAARELSVVELAEAHIAQIERLNPQLNAFADFDAERVRAQARRMMRCANGRAGPLHGLPVTVKSSIATAGYQVRDRQPAARGRDSRAKMRWWWRGCAQPAH